MIPATGKIKMFCHIIILYLMISSPLTISILLLAAYVIVFIEATKLIHAVSGTRKEDKHN